MLRGSTYRFEAPHGWKEARFGRTVAARHGGAEVSVTTFRLARRFTPKLWPGASKELDGVAARLARELHGRVTERATRTVAGRRARSYALAAASDGTSRIAFVLDGRREYQLLCRGDTGAACERLLASFRITA